MACIKKFQGGVSKRVFGGVSKGSFRRRDP